MSTKNVAPVLLQRLQPGGRKKIDRKHWHFAEPSREATIDTRIASLQVILCRYAAGKLEKKMLCVGKTKYFAISHVWGEVVQWWSVPGIAEKVLGSEEKS